MEVTFIFYNKNGMEKFRKTWNFRFAKELFAYLATVSVNYGLKIFKEGSEVVAVEDS